MRTTDQIHRAITIIDAILSESRMLGPPPDDAVIGTLELAAAAVALRWVAGGEEAFDLGLDAMEDVAERAKKRRRERQRRN